MRLPRMHRWGILGLGLLVCALGLLGGGTETAADQDVGIGIAGTGTYNPALTIGNVIHQIPCPGTDPRDLTWDGAYLWHVDNATRLIYKLDPADGSILQSFPAPGIETHQGLAWDGTYLWHSEYNTGRTWKIDPVDGSVLGAIYCPTSFPAGLTFDGTDLWTTSYRDTMIYRFSTADGSLLQSFRAPDVNPWGMAWNSCVPSLWHGNYAALPIYELDPVDGSVIQSFNSPPQSWLLGMTYDGTTLWAVDYYARQIYQIDVGGEPSASEPATWGGLKDLFSLR